MIGAPSSYFASPAFNTSPVPTRINGVREMNGPLFETLDRHGKDDAPRVFMEHVRVMFGLDETRAEGGKRRRGASYLRLLRGWFFDSNGAEGAVMKGWAESRFGLRPLYHAEPIDGPRSPAYYVYLSEKMSPRFNNNSIYSQLDLLYEYCQYYLERFGPAKRRLTLFRGANMTRREHQVIERRGRRLWVVRNNSLVSYTSSKERADEFGDTIIKIEAPLEKILCFPDLLPGGLPASEGEIIILGGDYLSEILDF